MRLVAVVRGDSKVSGSVTFEQASESAATTISWDITGHDPNAKRGMHIHTFGDNTNGCTSAGPHCESTLFPLGVASPQSFVVLVAYLNPSSQPSQQDPRRSYRREPPCG